MLVLLVGATVVVVSRLRVKAVAKTNVNVHRLYHLHSSYHDGVDKETDALRVVPLIN